MLIPKCKVLEVPVEHGLSSKVVADRVQGVVTSFLEGNPDIRVRAMSTVNISDFAVTPPCTSVILVSVVYDE